MRTARQLFNDALSFITVLEAGQEASAEDFDTVKGLFTPLLSELSTRGEFYLAPDIVIEDTLIPDDVYAHLSELLGKTAAPHFGKEEMSEAEREVRIMRIRRVVYLRPTYDPLKACYF
jgi:hypothetical protein